MLQARAVVRGPVTEPPDQSPKGKPYAKASTRSDIDERWATQGLLQLGDAYQLTLPVEIHSYPDLENDAESWKPCLL